MCFIADAFVIVVNAMSIRKDSQCSSLSPFSTPFPQRKFILAFLHPPLRFADSTVSLLSLNLHARGKHGYSHHTFPGSLCDFSSYISVRYQCSFEADLPGSPPLKGICPSHTKTPLRNKRADGGNRGSQGRCFKPQHDCS